MAWLTLLLAWAATADASVFDPLYRFRALRTDHFVVHFHQGEDRLAARLAVIAEEAWHQLERSLGRTPPPLTRVVLVDQTEIANGYAYVLPYDAVVIGAVWPSGSEYIGRLDDWLRLVFTHEFTHIVHLDRSESWARVVHGIFGRVNFAFPNVFLPTWQIEGLATYEETALTGEGRLDAGDFRAIVTEAARAGRLAPLDRVNGGLTDWPNGFAPYAYGVGFHAFLAERYGADKFAELSTATARRVPFTASRVFTRVYGRSLGDLWRDYQETVARQAPAAAAGAGAKRLTYHGFSVFGPRFARTTCAACAPEVIYSVRTPHGFPALNRLALDGSPPLRIATRYLGATTAIGRSTIYFDQQELHRNTGLYSDLYALDRASGHVRRVSSEARLLDPDLSPDEQTIVAVQDKPGRRDLVLVRLKPPFGVAQGGPEALEGPDATDGGASDAGAIGIRTTAIVTLISEPETQFNAPRWSPDGRMIAVERHRPGEQSAVVVVDVASRAIRVVASDPKARFVTPAWRPDGRALVAAADVKNGPFNLYELELDAPGTGRQLTATTGGATWPDISPDGASIVYVGYTADGFDVFQMPYVATGGVQALAASEGGREPLIRAPVPLNPTVGTPAEYSPLPTLTPTWWSPIVNADRHQVRLGAASGGGDVLGYHAYSVSATWLASHPAGAPAVDASTPDWQLFYVYGRWRPTLWASASRETSFFAGPPTDRGVPSTATLRERQLQAGLVFPVVHVRVAQTTIASLVRKVDEFTLLDGAIAHSNRSAARAGWTISSAHTYGYSISPEHGATLGMTAELVRRALGASADAFAVTGDARAYLPALAPHHVLALRLAGGTSSGDRDLRRTFILGGGASNDRTLDFGGGAMSLLRGFPSDTFAGTRVALANADYRWPIARPQRGLGTWPLFLHTIDAAVFADAGHAWTRTFRTRDLKTSAGAELSVDFVAGYSVPFTATVGAAWGRDGSHTVRNRATAYYRLGHAF